MQTKFPSWLIKRFPASGELKEVKELLQQLNLNTVCQGAHCPNIGECFARKTATFMILGNYCTRNCRFCAVKNGEPEKPDPDEPRNIARAAALLGLKHVVITSVTRDDLDDEGVQQFVDTVREIKNKNPETIIELLTPDFQGRIVILKRLVRTDFQIFNHNIETVPRLYQEVRPGADYQRSLAVLAAVQDLKPDIKIKSGLMVGLGEREEEVTAVMEDLRSAGCTMLTIGQYLRPSREHLEVKEFITPEQFTAYQRAALKLGFKAVASGPFVRSSFQAESLYQNSSADQ